MEPSSRLARRLGTLDAVVIGLGSMIGAGIFVAAGPAANAAGSGIIAGVLIAGVIAFLNAMTMAQLAAVYPESGGTYIYGRKLLGHYWGFMAGWGFVIGKLASCTAMALSFAYYTSAAYPKALAAGSVIFLTLVNSFGVKKTATLTKVLVTLVIFSLIVAVFATLFGGSAHFARLGGWTDRGGVSGILQAAGMMFFAFAGYARVATLGEEIINPRKTIPRAMIISLSITLLIYIIVITAVVMSMEMSLLVTSKAPVALAIESGSLNFLSPIVKVGACFASLSVLLSLLAGISRTIFAMAVNSDLPKKLGSIHPTYKIPHHAEITVGLIVATIVLFADIRSAIGFSSFAILIYYAIANASAWMLPVTERIWPRWTSGLGLVVCLIIALSLPINSIMGGVVLFVIGSTYHHFVIKKIETSLKFP